MLNEVDCPETHWHAYGVSQRSIKKYQKFVYKMKFHKIFDTGERTRIHITHPLYQRESTHRSQL